MDYHIVTRTLAAQRIAAVQRRGVPVGGVGAAMRPALDQVWAFLRRHEGLRTDGHNVFVYRGGGAKHLLDVDFGVQVTREFEGEGEVVSLETPAGEVVETLHVGPYERMGEAYAAVRAWCAASGREFSGTSWEIYGDWTDDPAKLETRIIHLLR